MKLSADGDLTRSSSDCGANPCVRHVSRSGGPVSGWATHADLGAEGGTQAGEVNRSAGMFWNMVDQ